MIFLLYPIGLFGGLLFAWLGRWRAFGIAAAMAAGVTLFAFLYPSAGNIGTHGSESEALAWACLIMAPYLALGCVVAAGLSFMLGTFGAQRREAEEMANMQPWDGTQ